MKKYFNLFFTIFVLFFITSCSPIEFFETVSYTLDKESYKIDEKICLKFLGNIDSNLYGDGVIYVVFSNGTADNDISKYLDYYENLNTQNISFSHKEYNSLVFNISSNAYDKIEEMLFFSISTKGDYKVTVKLSVDRKTPTPLVYYGKYNDKIDFTVTE